MRNVRQAHLAGTPPLGQIWWDWASGGNGGLAAFDMQSPEHYVEWIEPRLPRSHRLNEAVLAFGEPSDVVANAFCYPDNSGAYYVLWVIFEASRTALGTGGTFTPKTAGTILESDTAFERVVFSSLDEPLSRQWSGPGGGGGALVPWRGPQPIGTYLHDYTQGGCFGPTPRP